jgi:hypothetical protein
MAHPRSLEILESLGILEPFLATGVEQQLARLHSGASDAHPLGFVNRRTRIMHKAMSEAGKIVKD